MSLSSAIYGALSVTLSFIIQHPDSSSGIAPASRLLDESNLSRHERELLSDSLDVLTWSVMRCGALLGRDPVACALLIIVGKRYEATGKQQSPVSYELALRSSTAEFVPP